LLLLLFLAGHVSCQGQDQDQDSESSQDSGQVLYVASSILYGSCTVAYNGLRCIS
jgi:hypothetical protein